MIEKLMLVNDESLSAHYKNQSINSTKIIFFITKASLQIKLDNIILRPNLRTIKNVLPIVAISKFVKKPINLIYLAVGLVLLYVIVYYVLPSNGLVKENFENANVDCPHLQREECACVNFIVHNKSIFSKLIFEKAKFINSESKGC